MKMVWCRQKCVDENVWCGKKCVDEYGLVWTKMCTGKWFGVDQNVQMKMFWRGQKYVDENGLVWTKMCR